MTNRIPGRHRRLGRLRTASHLTRSAAIAATSTGLLAASALTTATATPVLHEPPSLSQDDAASGETVGAPQADALNSLIEAGLLSEQTLSLDAPAKAESAPADVAPDNFGVSGFTATSTAVETVAEPAAAETSSAETAGESHPEHAAETAGTASQEQAAAALDSRTETSASRSEQRAQAPVTQAPAAPAPQPAPAPPAAGGAVGIASGLMGIPYAWAGSSPSVGFDCSGFTSYVYAQLGISLPRTAAMQQAFATPVSSPQPGDLVFFGTPAWHVGIYAGNGMIYQATNPGSVSNYMPIASMYGSVSGYGRVG